MVDDKSKVMQGNEELTSRDWLPGLYTAVSCKAMVSISDLKETYYMESGA